MSTAEQPTKKKNWFARHKVLSALLATFAIIIIIVAATGDKGDGNNTAAPSASPDDSTTQQAEPTTSQEAPKPVEPKVYQGTGDDVIDIQKPTDGPAIVTFECANCTGNTAVTTNGAEALLVNEIGGYSGSQLIDTSNGSNTTQLTIKASGRWTTTVGGLDKATAVSGQPAAGQGDSVLHITGGTTKAAITNSGAGNFSISVYPEGGGFPDLPINTIGSYKGTVPLDAPAYVQIHSSGNWTVAPQ